MQRALSREAMRPCPTQTPIFSIAYLGSAGSSPTLQRHHVIYAGGGGSSKTGVGNAIVAAEVGETDLVELCRLDTGAELCSLICIGPKKKLLPSVFGNRFRICKLSGFGTSLQSQRHIAVASNDYVSDFKNEGPSINCCALDDMRDVLAVGGDDGMLRIWAVSNEKGRFRCTLMKAFSPGHASSITDCSFSESRHLLATASKDGTCLVCSLSTGATICKVSTSCAMPLSQANDYHKKTPSAKLLVRACKFVGDDGLISVQSRSRGDAYATKWTLVASDDQGGTLDVGLVATRRISRHPVSAVCLEGELIVHGNVEGLVGIASTTDLSSLGRHVQAHELPVTALVISSSVSSIPPRVLSVSADYKLVTTSLTPTTRVTMARVYVLIALIAFLLRSLLYTYAVRYRLWCG